MRTPSMSIQAAEALIGPRGSIHVNSDNRTMVRKWLVANGFPSMFVGGLSLTELGLAYNQTDGAMLAKLREKLAAARDEIGEDNSDDSDDAPKTAPKSNGANGHAITAEGSDKAAAAARALAELFASTQGHKSGPIDADAVREIIKAELPSLIPVTRLEISTNGAVRDMGAKPRHEKLPVAIKIVARGIPLALVGPAGSGKTTAAEQIAEALELPFYMNGAVSGAHEYLGFVDAQGRYQTTPFRQAFEHGGVYLADELDGGDAAAILVINSALANCHMPFPDRPEPVKKHENFRMIAAANTYGNGADRIYVGRNQLDGATLDRFAFVAWDYDEKLESQLCGNPGWVARVQKLRAAVAREKARIIISPRATIYGAGLLADGVPQSDVEAHTIWKGTDAELRRRIENAAG